MIGARTGGGTGARPWPAPGWALVVALLLLAACAPTRSQPPEPTPSWAGATPAAPVPGSPAQSRTSSIPTATPSKPPPPGETVTVTHVSDGDTFSATRGNGQMIRVRLLGIDAPEVSHAGSQPECGAQQATSALRKLVAGRRVILSGDPLADPIDRFGRHLSYVTVNRTDAALSMVSAGMAEAWYPGGEPMPERYPDYRAAEAVARATGIGLWRTCRSIGR